MKLYLIEIFYFYLFSCNLSCAEAIEKKMKVKTFFVILFSYKKSLSYFLTGNSFLKPMPDRVAA